MLENIVPHGDEWYVMRYSLTMRQALFILRCYLTKSFIIQRNFLAGILKFMSKYTYKYNYEVKFMAVNLSKGQKVSLVKKSDAPVGEISINLNWTRPEKKSDGFFSSLFGGNYSIDLDLGCLYELKDGTAGCVQALGNAFGSFDNFPYIELDGDDRTGDNESGENMRINGNKIKEIKRVLIYTFIYEGVTKWKEADAIVTFKCQGEDFVVRMDEYNDSKSMCALALLENDNDKSFAVEKIVRFFDGHDKMDKAFNWGLEWVYGSKD